MEDRINGMITDAVQDIFCKLQEENNIQSGDCPWDAQYDIDCCIEKLAGHIATVIRLNLATEEEEEAS